MTYLPTFYREVPRKGNTRDIKLDQKAPPMFGSRSKSFEIR